MILLNSVPSDKALKKLERRYIHDLIRLYIHIDEEGTTFNNMNTDKINNFIRLLTKIIKNRDMVSQLNECIFPIASGEITGKIIAIRHSQTYENIFHHQALESGTWNKIKGHAELLSSHFRNSPVTCVGHLMIESSHEQLAKNKKLQKFIKTNFPLVIRSEKKRTHVTGNGILDPIEDYDPLKFNLYMFNEKDPETLLKMPEYYRLARMMIACIPVNNLVIIGHSGWFRDFFNQTKDPNMVGVINPSDNKMYNAQGLLYNYKLPSNMDIVSKWGGNKLKKSLLFSYNKCLFQPDMEEIEQTSKYQACITENTSKIHSKNSRRNVHTNQQGSPAT